MGRGGEIQTERDMEERRKRWKRNNNIESKKKKEKKSLSRSPDMNNWTYTWNTDLSLGGHVYEAGSRDGVDNINEH